jgi:SAM-dependent methyltransferase
MKNWRHCGHPYCADICFWRLKRLVKTETPHPRTSQFHRDTEFFKGFYRAGRSDEEILKATTLDWFGRRAYEGFLRRISGKEARILEAGVGSGRFCTTLAERFSHTHYVGLDIVAELAHNVKRVRRIKRLSNLDALVGDITRLPFPDDTFDVCFNQGVVEHTGGLHREALIEMARVTRPRGVVVVTVPNYYCFPHTFRRALREWLKQPPLTGDEPPFKHREMAQYFRDAGLSRIQIEGYYFMQSIIRLPTFSFLNRYRLTRKAGYLILSHGGMAVERFLIPLIDGITGGWFSNRFGFEIMVSGIKT